MVDCSWLSTPVGLVVSPTRLPCKMSKLFSRSTSMPVFTFAPLRLAVKSSSTATRSVGVRFIFL